MQKDDKIYIAGHTGLVGSALFKKLKQEGYKYIITAAHKHLDLRSKGEVEQFIGSAKPDYIIICAGTVGGIMANNTRRAEFIYDNIMMQTNIIHYAYEYGVKKLMAIGSSCIYPKNCPQPIKEEYLLTGELEATNEPYAIAKIAAIKMCEAYRAQYGCNFITAMPTNLYGEKDNYENGVSHVLAALIRKFHDAKINFSEFVLVWGTGQPYREFMHVDDLAEAILFLMNNYDEAGTVNIGTGEDITIQDLALMVKEIVGYSGQIYNDVTKPDGTSRKLLDVSKINNLGWKAKIGLREGIEKVYKDYIK
jgi:GDP-L-fucose synthase